MKKTLILLLFFCIGFLFMSCEKNAVESDEITITIPDIDDITLTLTNVYPTYFQPMSGDGEAGKPYSFYFKTGGTITSNKTFSVYTADYTDGEYTSEQFVFDAEEPLILKTGDSYTAWGYADGRILSEYEKIPVAMLTFEIVSEEEYEKIISEGQYAYWVAKYTVDTLKSK